MRFLFQGLTIVLVSSLCYICSTRLGLKSEYAIILSWVVTTAVVIWMVLDKKNTKSK